MRRNLPPEAEQWGRTVDNAVQKLEQSVRTTSQDTLNALKGVNASVSAIAQQVERLNNITETLSIHQAELMEQQTRLENQQGELQEQQSVLLSLIETQSRVQMIRGSESAFGVTAGEDRTIVQTVYTVPEGYTRAVVFGSYVSGVSFSSVTDGGTIGSRVRMDTSTGSWSLGVRVTTDIVYGGFASAAAFRAALFSELPVGSTITVSGMTRTWPSVDSNENNYAALDGMITFLK